LKEISKLKQIQISLDGATAETHDRVRGKGAFNKAIETVKLLQASGLEITLMFTLQGNNMPDIPQLIELAKEENVKALAVERGNPCSSGNALKNPVLSPQELRDGYRYFTDRAENHGVMERRLVIRRSRTLWADTCKGQNSSDIVGGFCPMGLTSLAILHDGTVLPCRRLNIALENILE
jgi:MoaA/NifB/PqqE/SkfB family radical SAM enzyme